MGFIWRDYKITIKRSRGLLEENMKKMKKDEKKRSSWKEKNSYMKRAWYLEDEIIKSNRLCDLYEEIMRYTKREYEIYTVRSRNLHEDSMISKRRKVEIYTKRAWYVHAESMMSMWKEHEM